MQTLERLWPKIGCEFLKKRRTTFFDKRRLTLFEKTWPQLFAKLWRLEQANARTNTRRTPKNKLNTRFQITMFFIVFFFNVSRLNKKSKLTSTNWTTLAGPRLTLNSGDIRRTKIVEKLTKISIFFCWIWHQNDIYLYSNLHRKRLKNTQNGVTPSWQTLHNGPTKIQKYNKNFTFLSKFHEKFCFWFRKILQRMNEGTRKSWDPPKFDVEFRKTTFNAIRGRVNDFSTFTNM